MIFQFMTALIDCIGSRIALESVAPKFPPAKSKVEIYVVNPVSFEAPSKKSRTEGR